MEENSQPQEAAKLPENAFRELKEGETYKPLMPAGSHPREADAWSVTWGLVMVIIFSAATAYLGLKVGQVFEAAIPIAIIAVGLSGVTRRRGAMGENVIIQSIGACSGSVVAGAIFTLPALYILQAKYPDISVDFVKVFLASFLGGALGIFFLIPFRKYFVRDMHGKYPFPEATATTQVLVSGEGGGTGSLMLLLKAGVIGGLYDFAVASFGLWNEQFTSRVCSLGNMIADKAKFVFKLNTGAAVLGMGYIVGLKYSAVICAGSVLVWWIIVPCIALLFPDMQIASGTGAGTVAASQASPEVLFAYARSIGIGAIAMAGIIGIIKSRKIVVGAISLARREMTKKSNAEETSERTQKDIPMKIIIFGTALTLIVVFCFFLFGVMGGNLLYAVVGILLVALIAFLFTTVAANAIAIVGSNPVSGMTLMTLILTSVIMVAVGLRGTAGIVAALLMGGVVCTALSMAGSFVTDLKIGYWLGTTPKVQESYKFLGTLVAALTVGGVMIVLNNTYGFTGDALAAPQAHAMAAVIEPLMNGGSAPWLLYGIGAAIAIVLDMLGISALAFALGMFIPLELNPPLLVGGLISWKVKRAGKTAEEKHAADERGTLIASGFIAGGALMGVVSAAMRFAGLDLTLSAWVDNPLSQLLSIVVYALLIIGFFTMVRQKKTA